MDAGILIGSPVVIRAGDNPDWSFVDGWRGTVIDIDGGLYVFRGPNPDGIAVRLLVAAEHLAMDTNTAPLKFCTVSPLL